MHKYSRLLSSEPTPPYELEGRRGSWPFPGEGFTLAELMAALAILLLLSSVALPLMQVQIKRARETELRRDLREMRQAIDHYKRFADAGTILAKPDTLGYPPDLETLVRGTPISGRPEVNFKFLRRIPIDPMTGSKDWGLRSVQDDPDSRSWGGQNVFDVYTKSDKKGLDGTSYAGW
jgi:general secretion pathway protein G